MSKEKPPAVASIMPVVCGHGNLTLYLRDKSGAVMATATMDIDAATDLIDDIVGQFKALTDADTIGACEGHA